MKKEQTQPVVRRREKDWITVDDLVKNKSIPISTFDFSSVCGLKNVIFESYEKLKWTYNENVSISANRFWHTSGLFSTQGDPCPYWSGYIRVFQKVAINQNEKL